MGLRPRAGDRRRGGSGRADSILGSGRTKAEVLTASVVRSLRAANRWRRDHLIADRSGYWMSQRRVREVSSHVVIEVPPASSRCTRAVESSTAAREERCASSPSTASAGTGSSCPSPTTTQDRGGRAKVLLPAPTARSRIRRSCPNGGRDLFGRDQGRSIFQMSYRAC